MKDVSISATYPPGAASQSKCPYVTNVPNVLDPYSGEWKGEAEWMMFSVNHQVAPKEQALKCNNCHSPNGVMDFKALGYAADRVEQLTKDR